jgi:hypothetical protein
MRQFADCPTSTVITSGGQPVPAQVGRPGPALNHNPARADETSMGRLVFYPIAIGLFVLVDMALRAHGH